MVHEVAAQGFNDPNDYEAARPSYPPDAVAWFADKLNIGPGAHVCDLAAGTGKFTRLLEPLGADLIAIEPVPGMRATFKQLLPDVPCAAGTSEALPLKNDALDALVVAQAWHWFDHERAGAEARRVVKPSGGLGLVWNARDRSVAWVDAIWSIMDRVEKRAPWRNHDNWRDSAFDDMPGFQPWQIAEFHHSQSVTPKQMEQRVASVSHVAVLPDDERQEVLAEVRELLSTHPDTAGRDQLDVPYRADCLVALRDNGH